MTFISTTTLAFGFSNLAMLGWLAAAAAPILIHLWSRRKYREVPWAAVKFLLAAMRRSSRRIQLQQWLLLAVRTLIIVLVVLAVAEPYGVGSLALGPSGAPTHKVLVIDGSYSMAFQAGEATLFAHAKRLATELVHASSPSDVFTVVLMADPAVVAVDRNVIDHSAVIAKIESLSPQDTGGDLPGAIALIDAEFEEQRGRRGGDYRKEVYFITDLQRTSWGGADQRAGAEAVERLAALAKQAALAAIDVGEFQRDNLAVTQFTTPDPFVTTSGETTFTATLHQYGDRPREKCVVELIVDDVPVAEQSMDVPDSGDAAVRFAYRFRTAGDHAIAVRAAGDHLPLDDARWLAVSVRDEVRVLCVEGKRGAARFLADALDPDPTDASPVRPIVVSEGDLAELELDRFDAVFLCNVGRLSPGEGERLRRYAESGGGLIVFLGDQTRPESYNALATGMDGNRTPGNGLLPARIGELVRRQSFAIDPFEYRHPIVTPFRGRERSGLLTTPVEQYFRLSIDGERAGVEVAAALAGGDPWIVTAALGRGRIVLVATDGSLSSVDAATGEPWTAWPTWPSYLPLVREMLAYSSGGRREEWERLVGSPILPRDGELLRVGEVINVTRPDSRTDKVQVERGNDGGVWSYGATDRTGIYSVRASRGREPQLFAVNLDTAESDLAKVDLQQLPAELIVRTGIAPSGEIAGRDLLPQRGWQGTFLAIAFGLLLAESLLAWLFGRGTL